MAATLFFSFLSSNPPFTSENQSKLHQSMFIFIFFCSFTLSILSLSVLILALYRRHKKTEQKRLNSITRCPLPETVNKDPQIHESDLTQLTNSLLLEILPSNSPKWVNLFGGEGCEYPGSNGSGLEREGTNSGEEECGKKKKKKRAKKKRANSSDSNAGEGAGEGQQTKEKQELVCLYPFTSSSSATQRKIKQQYDQLVKSHEKNGLTLAQVGQFVNCLVEARTELQHKSEAIQRKFTITKALLFKADRSSFDRIRQQIYKLELEQKRLEEDAFVYNWLQQQLKLSPAYKKMVEIGECMELNSKSDELEEDEQTEFSDISFEELLAQEKKDSFWQRNGKPRTVSE